MSEDEQPVATRSTALPAPTHSVTTAAAYLAAVVDEDMGTRNGRTALFWHLIAVIQKHAKGTHEQA